MTMKFMIIRLVKAALWIVAVYKFGDWRNWKKYYSSMLFFATGDLIYNVVFYNNRLWEFQSDFLVPSLNEIFIIFTVFFSTVLLYLSRFPKKLHHQFVYILLWIALYMVIEIFTTSIGMQINHNGWNIWWSLLHNAIQFPLIILHHKNPILAWILCFIFLIVIMNIFGVALTISK